MVKFWRTLLAFNTREADAVNVGQAIRLCRNQRGVSQSDIAHQASCSVSYLSMLENNKRDPTLSTISKIAQALDVPVGLLFILASDNRDLESVDLDVTDKLKQSALRVLVRPSKHLIASKTGTRKNG